MDLKQERKLWQKGYQWVVGVDEAGRGPLAGPVVAAAITIDPTKLKVKSMPCIVPSPEFGGGLVRGEKLRVLLKEVNDSKQLGAKKREELYNALIDHPVIEWGRGRVGPKVIDRINILEATKLAMKRAFKNLEKKIDKKYSHGRIRISRGVSRASAIHMLILDGKMKLNLEVPQESIIKADEKVFSCAAASVIAKVSRDRTMIRYHKKYPQYGFDKHKGYGTEYHRKMLKKYGPCRIHRRSFKPISISN